MTARSAVAFDLAGEPTFIDPYRVKWRPLNGRVLSYRDPRIPGTEFHFAWVGLTQTDRWFLRGSAGINRWYGCMRGEHGYDYLQVTPEQAAAWFHRAEEPLPPELADIVSRHLGTGDDPTTGDERQGTGTENEGKGKTDDPAPSNPPPDPTIKQPPKGTLDRLPPARLKAFSQWQHAIKANSHFDAKTPDREIYEWLEDHSDGDNLPTFATWGRYLRQARNQHGLSKNRPRRGRTGRSIADREQL